MNEDLKMEENMGPYGRLAIQNAKDTEAVAKHMGLPKAQIEAATATAIATTITMSSALTNNRIKSR